MWDCVGQRLRKCLGHPSSPGLLYLLPREDSRPNPVHGFASGSFLNLSTRSPVVHRDWKSKPHKPFFPTWLLVRAFRSQPQQGDQEHLPPGHRLLSLTPLTYSEFKDRSRLPTVTFVFLGCSQLTSTPLSCVQPYENTLQKTHQGQNCVFFFSSWFQKAESIWGYTDLRRRHFIA